MTFIKISVFLAALVSVSSCGSDAGNETGESQAIDEHYTATADLLINDGNSELISYYALNSSESFLKLAILFNHLSDESPQSEVCPFGGGFELDDALTVVHFYDCFAWEGDQAFSGDLHLHKQSNGRTSAEYDFTFNSSQDNFRSFGEFEFSFNQTSDTIQVTMNNGLLTISTDDETATFHDFSLIKNENLKTKNFDIEYQFELHSSLMSGKIDCQTASAIKGVVNFVPQTVAVVCNDPNEQLNLSLEEGNYRYIYQTSSFQGFRVGYILRELLDGYLWSSLAQPPKVPTKVYQEYIDLPFNYVFDAKLFSPKSILITTGTVNQSESSDSVSYGPQHALIISANLITGEINSRILLSTDNYIGSNPFFIDSLNSSQLLVLQEESGIIDILEIDSLDTVASFEAAELIDSKHKFVAIAALAGTDFWFAWTKDQEVDGKISYQRHLFEGTTLLSSEPEAWQFDSHSRGPLLVSVSADTALLRQHGYESRYALVTFGSDGIAYGPIVDFEWSEDIHGAVANKGLVYLPTGQQLEISKSEITKRSAPPYWRYSNGFDTAMYVNEPEATLDYFQATSDAIHVHRYNLADLTLGRLFHSSGEEVLPDQFEMSYHPFIEQDHVITVDRYGITTALRSLL